MKRKGANEESIQDVLLIIDDNPAYRTALRKILEQEYTIVEARDGQEGFKTACLFRPDIILCDVKMPLADGYACCRSLKNYEETRYIPIVLLTGEEEVSGQIRGLELGADDYVFKSSCRPDFLRTKLKNILTNRKLLRKHYFGEEIVSETDKNSFIFQVYQVIREHLSEPDFGVNKLAEYLSISPLSLYRKIKHEIVLTPIQLIRVIRLRKALHLLESGSYNVSEAAFAVGYNDVSSFRRHFTDYFGKTPSSCIQK